MADANIIFSRSELSNLPSGLSRRKNALRSLVSRFEAKYGMTLDALETRLAKGLGQEHPNREDSIE